MSDLPTIIPVFPLPNVVLFPQVMLPLHIFEPRYRLMTADALAGDRFLGMVLLRPGWESDYQGRPAVYPVGCLGRILAEQRLDDGRFNLVLRGVARMRLSKEIEQDKPYRYARAELLTDLAVPPTAETVQLREELAAEATRWFQAMGAGAEQLYKLLQSNLTLGPLSDVLSFAL